MSRALPLTITPAAIAQVKHLLAQRENPALGVRIMIKTKGCSGLAYALEYVDEKPASDEEVEIDGVKVFVEPQAVMYLIGAEMDFVTEKMQSGFTFKNPNEKGRCGCGESFHV